MLDRVRAGCRDRRLGPVVRSVHRCLPGVGAHRELLGGDPHPGRGHQDRQHSCPPAADRSGLASPAPVSARARFCGGAGRVVAISAALQRIHTFGDIWAEIARARRVRGIGASRRSPAALMAEVWALTIGMLVRSLQAAAALAVAMDARGFSTAYRRTWAAPAPWRLGRHALCPRRCRPARGRPPPRLTRPPAPDRWSAHPTAPTGRPCTQPSAGTASAESYDCVSGAGSY